ncbi:MAG TPA: TIGR00725 family protein [Nitrospirota bacterium]|nr:TIGR00725 family protein [Nitrospirota bacterium]
MTTKERPKIIGVIGGRQVDGSLLKEAEKVGEIIAAQKALLVCGGLTGVMEASAKGAKAKGGITIGIIPHDHTREVNEYIDIPIVTGMGIGRNVIIARTADALIAVGGEYGTLSEIAYALQLGKTVVGIKTWDIKGVTPAKNAEDAVKKALNSAAV